MEAHAPVPAHGLFPNHRRLWAALVLSAGIISSTPAEAQPAGFNYDESKVPAYTLPEALTCLDGSKVTTPAQWISKRRPELLKLFERNVYGETPSGDVTVREEWAGSASALNGIATRKQVRLVLERNGILRRVDVLMYLPAGAKKPVPAFIGYNFNGNQTVHADLGIKLPESWVRIRKEAGQTNNIASEKTRGDDAQSWQVEKLVRRGYGLVTAYYGDIFPDRDDGLRDSVITLFENGAKDRAPEAWNAIGAWAWGLSRIVDHLQQGRDVDMKRLALIGHSRLGKTALWAGANDDRFQIVISNNSGEGGAALARRCFGETTARINTSFPHWFCGAFKQYNDREAEMPVDQHELLALIAPRPLYVASAVEDKWADPKGEFLSAKAAGEVYALFGKKGVGVAEQPPVDQPVGSDIGYHVRTGKHDVTSYDWDRYLDFADRHFGKPR